MSVVLKKSDDGLINAKDMMDGQLSVIVEWPSGTYIGQVIQRSNSHLFAVGSIHYWSDFFTGAWNSNEKCRVRVLKPGEELMVT